MRRKLTIVASLIVAVIAVAVAIPHLMPMNESICSRESSYLDMLSKDVTQFHSRNLRYPSKGSFWTELLGTKAGRNPPKDHWGYEYEVAYGLDDSPALKSAGLERNCSHAFKQ